MYKERCETSDEQYRRLLVQFERETTLQNERAREYEQLASRVRELSASLTPELRRSSTSCRQSHIPVPLADSNSDSKTVTIGSLPSPDISLRETNERKGEAEKGNGTEDNNFDDNG
ncbi:unnamed protein product [Anisakis simplex]|uniref:Uncharacterized protein n=1 Tax=Anisakis simplex TaxID=6269 RepID=A0A0M3IYV5_ANISI|nr:unnamed protein product [Anisakis simplex]